MQLYEAAHTGRPHPNMSTTCRVKGVLKHCSNIEDAGISAGILQQCGMLGLQGACSTAGSFEMQAYLQGYCINIGDAGTLVRILQRCQDFGDAGLSQGDCRRLETQA